MVLGRRTFEARSALGRPAFGREGSGTRRQGETFIGGTKPKASKDPLHKGLTTLMNRSEMKGIVDPTERSKAMGADISRKLVSLEGATGKDRVDILKTIGQKA
jgi:hypothetical protein